MWCALYSISSLFLPSSLPGGTSFSIRGNELTEIAGSNLNSLTIDVTVSHHQPMQSCYALVIFLPCCSPSTFSNIVISFTKFYSCSHLCGLEGISAVSQLDRIHSYPSWQNAAVRNKPPHCVALYRIASVKFQHMHF